jgi:hypothetical protein
MDFVAHIDVAVCSGGVFLVSSGIADLCFINSFWIVLSMQEVDIRMKK